MMGPKYAGILLRTKWEVIAKFSPSAVITPLQNRKGGVASQEQDPCHYCCAGCLKCHRELVNIPGNKALNFKSQLHLQSDNKALPHPILHQTGASKRQHRRQRRASEPHAVHARRESFFSCLLQCIFHHRRMTLLLTPTRRAPSSGNREYTVTTKAFFGTEAGKKKFCTQGQGFHFRI